MAKRLVCWSWARSPAARIGQIGRTTRPRPCGTAVPLGEPEALEIEVLLLRILPDDPWVGAMARLDATHVLVFCGSNHQNGSTGSGCGSNRAAPYPPG